MKFTRENFTSPRGIFFSSREKIADTFTSLRNLVGGERHVSPAIHVFIRGRLSSLREEVAEKEQPCEVYHSSCGFSWSKVACGTTQTISPKIVLDLEEEDVET